MINDLDLLIERRVNKTKKQDLPLENLQEMIVEALDAKMESLLVENKSLSLTWDGIPTIGISEIGWSKMSGEEGKKIPSEQRTELINYLRTIKGASLKEKLGNIQNFYKGALPELEGASSPEKIKLILSYLVFFKTLTTIIRDFNPASAGFTFESFLATLLGKQQIPAQGSKTIADITDDITVKLISAKGRTEGSYTNLTKTLVGREGVEIEKLKFFIAMKEGDDEVEKIKVYQLNITLDNVLDILSKSENTQHIRLRRPEPIEQPEEPIEQPEELEASAKVTMEAQKRKFAGRDYFPWKKSIKIYSSLDQEQKKAALETSYGRLAKMKFSIKKDFVEAQGDLIGELEVGQKGLDDLLKRVSMELDEAVYKVIQNTKDMTKSLNLFFTSGLEIQHAEGAIASAKEIIEGTEDLTPKKTSPAAGEKYLE
tara:strand:+ start:511 stop:1794 length:1284 start_codon:yes stop_codon:yes gene_type:complete